MSEWQLLSRPDCSLCESMQEELLQLLGPRAARVRIIDVGDDPELERKYGQRIPVLLIGGEFVCAYRLDVERVAGYLFTIP